MTTIEQSIDIEVPVAVAYNQWTQFESFPQFMDGVERVEQKPTRSCTGSPISVARRGSGTPRSPSSIPTNGWRGRRSTRGPDGVVTFHKLDDARTRVMVQMDYEPEGMKESVAASSGSTTVGSRRTSRRSRASSRPPGARTAAGAATSRTRQGRDGAGVGRLFDPQLSVLLSMTSSAARS